MGSSGALFATEAATTAIGTYAQSKALKAKGNYEAQIAETNARYADLAAEDTLARGDKTSSQVRREGKRVKGAQRAGFAGQGVDVNTGTAQAVQDSTETLSEMDALTVKNNAWREAWGYKTQAQDYRAQGRMARLSTKFDRATTLLTGGLQTIRSGADYGYREKLARSQAKA